jgi:hypothetical protein
MTSRGEGIQRDPPTALFLFVTPADLGPVRREEESHTRSQGVARAHRGHREENCHFTFALRPAQKCSGGCTTALYKNESREECLLGFERIQRVRLRRFFFSSPRRFRAGVQVLPFVRESPKEP